MKIMDQKIPFMSDGKHPTSVTNVPDSLIVSVDDEGEDESEGNVGLVAVATTRTGRVTRYHGLPASSSVMLDVTKTQFPGLMIYLTLLKVFM